MILTTTDRIEGRQITEYCGLVFGEVVAGINFMSDFSANITDFIGGRSDIYQSELISARSQALNEMIMRAQDMGGNAIVGIKVDYEMLGSNNSMMMVNVTGTAVKID